MNIKIRPLTDSDIQTYRICYGNAEFKHFIYGDKSINIDDSFSKLIGEKNNRTEAYLVLSKDGNSDSEYGVVGFCSFTMRQEYPIKISKETYTFNGGILPTLFNTGMGIFACASLLKLFFFKHLDSDLYASTFGDNIRSSRMLIALGFKQLGLHMYDKNHFLLDAKHFKENDFVIRLMSRMQLDFAACI